MYNNTKQEKDCMTITLNIPGNTQVQMKASQELKDTFGCSVESIKISHVGKKTLLESNDLVYSIKLCTDHNKENSWKVKHVCNQYPIEIVIENKRQKVQFPVEVLSPEVIARNKARNEERKKAEIDNYLRDGSNPTDEALEAESLAYSSTYGVLPICLAWAVSTIYVCFEWKEIISSTIPLLKNWKNINKDLIPVITTEKAKNAGYFILRNFIAILGVYLAVRFYLPRNYAQNNAKEEQAYQKYQVEQRTATINHFNELITMVVFAAKNWQLKTIEMPAETPLVLQRSSN